VSIPHSTRAYKAAPHARSAQMRPTAIDVAWSECLNVSLRVYLSVSHNREPYKSGQTDPDGFGV